MIKLKPILEEVTKKTLYFTIGISGSGKSTYLNKHFSKDIIVNPDNIRRKLTGDVSNQSMNTAVWEQAYSDLQNLLDTKGKAVLDGVNTSSFYRNISLKNFQSPEIYKVALVFNANPEVSKERIAQQIANGEDRASVPPEVVDRQYEEFKKGYADLFQQFNKVIVVK